MKNLVISAILILSLVSCTKQSPTPDGPTDIRIRNVTDSDFLNINVTTGKDEEDHNFGDLASGQETEYFRFETAYPDAEITLSIGDKAYTTGEPDNTYSVLLQQGKFTYEVWVSVDSQGLLDTKVIADAPLDDIK